MTAKKQAPVANNNKAGKTVSHTVRVDIEKLDVLMNLVSELVEQEETDDEEDDDDELFAMQRMCSS